MNYLYSNNARYMRVASDTWMGMPNACGFFRVIEYANGKDQPYTDKYYAISADIIGWGGSSSVSSFRSHLYKLSCTPYLSGQYNYYLERVATTYSNNKAQSNTDLAQAYTTSTRTVEFCTDFTEVIRFYAEQMTEFHSDPVYVEATKLRYTDGTYNFIRGNADA